MAFSHLSCPTTSSTNFFPSFTLPSSSLYNFRKNKSKDPLTLSSSSNSFKSKYSPSMEPHETGSKFKEFPYLSEPQKTLMLDLVSMVETQLPSSSLLLYPLPPDVHFYHNTSGTSQAALQLMSGVSSSPVDVILGSWIHSKLPSGGSLDITSLFSYLKSTTDAPNFLFEIIQNSPSSFVLILDLPPRKDLVLHPDYLDTFYVDTNLDKYRQSLELLPEAKPYLSPSLYIRAFFSPAVILFRVDTTDTGGVTRAHQIIEEHVGPIAKEMLKTWLDFVRVEREVDEAERDILEKRDKIIKNQALEIDLGKTFPMLFGQEVTDRVLGVLREVYNNAYE